MEKKIGRLMALVSLVCAMMLGVSLAVNGQYGKNEKGSEKKTTENKSTTTKSSKTKKVARTPSLTATLVDPENKAKQKAATVEVKVTGIALIDPAKVKEQPRAGQGHLHYQVDGGPIIATPTTKLSFHGLTSGEHKIVVTLAGNDHNPLGPEQTLSVNIP
jgi:hypothetical protein